MNKKIFIVNQDLGYLTIDVANAFKECYDKVVLFSGSIDITDRNLHPEIKIFKTIKYNRKSTLKRLFTWGACTMHLTFLLLFKFRGYKVLYYTNPPMSYFNALFFSNSFSVVVFDLYPNALKLIGINENSFLYRIWKRINIQVFKKADQIVTLSEGIKEQLSCYVDNNKIKVVSIWPGSEKFKPIPKNENLFLKKHNWENKFIVLYSGNMGIGHKLEVMIDVAENFIDREEFLFLFIGDGAKKKILANLVHNKNLTNVEFLPFQESNILPYSLASADIAVVALEPEVTYASVPSKTFNYMAVGAPILGIGSSGSELENLINYHKVGLYSSGEDANELSKYIDNFFENKSELKKISFRSYSASKRFNYAIAQEYLF